MRPDWKIPSTILLCSLASLAYEVALTRIFSIALWYHFAFMIISIAMLGLAASGAALALWPGLKQLIYIGRFSLLLGIAIPASALVANQIAIDPVQLLWERKQLFNIALLYLTLACPFFCCGLTLATAFSVQSARAALLYGADLLGAGTGAFGILLLLNLLAPERVVFLLALPPLLAAGLSASTRLRLAVLICSGVSLAIFIGQPDFATIRMSPYKGLVSALRFPGAVQLKSYTDAFARIDTFASPAARFAPGLSLRWATALPRQVGVAVDGGEISAITAGDDTIALGFVDDLPAALPYALGPKEKVLVLDPKGGLPLLLARHYAAGEVVSVESNPALARVLRNDWEDFTGHLYAGRSYTGLGRSWLRAHDERFDLIDIGLTGVEPYGAFGIAEDFRFSIEAIQEYLGHLRRGGLLSINLYLLPPPRTELRLFTTVVAALEARGIREPARHLALVRSWGTLSLLVKESPLDADDLARIERFADARWFDQLHPPRAGGGIGQIQERLAKDPYAQACAALLDPERRGPFLADYPFDIAPVRDDAPFFHYFLKARSLGAVYQLMGQKWQFFLEEGGIVPVVLAQATVLSLFLILLPLLRRPQQRQQSRRGHWLLPYFALLGGGFMFIETALIHRIILPLEHPALAVATVLAALLISGGSGSLLSQRFPALQGPATAAAIALLALGYSLVLPVAATALAPWALAHKLAAVFALFIPMGLLLGIPFPCGLRTLGETAPQLLPWAWVINGCCSVLAPLLAILLATVAGFSTVLAVGAAAYGLAGVNLYLCQRTGGD